MTATEITRMATYLIGLALGVFLTVWGVIHSDASLITAGLALTGVGGTAGGALATQTRSRGKYAA